MLWRIEMLGWLRATRADQRIATFRTRKAGVLLAYLAYYYHRSHPREVLIELLWPSSSGRAGRTNLRTELSWLRQQLEPPGYSNSGSVLLAEGDTVRLNPERCHTDVATFELTLQAAARASTSSQRVEHLSEAIRLYQGELLPGHFDAWVVAERLRLEDAFGQAMQQLIVERELCRSGSPGSALVDREQALCQKLCARTAEAEALRQQLTLQTAEATELSQWLAAERAESRQLRQELALRVAEAQELWRQLRLAGQGRG